ncbi:lipase family protein [Streptomyces sp. MUM 2J]|uniref:lipase family protein n=1 Tax=Streptomyces sp. MUM 2J TaxID=2791987 RepID=UPI001F045F69|nr:lipase family protein [Streptomyces sp. MUM 2J]MCH0563503.1 triacylglycerol lipase [Streptomyces sp. MUM 2J]
MSHRTRKSSLRRAALLGAAAVLGGAFALPSTAAAADPVPQCTAADSAIYRPPGSVTAAPGTVLACRAVDSLPMVVGAPAFHAWKALYASTDGHDNPSAVAGTVIVPDAPWRGAGERPVVAFTPGTLGIGSQCAFSKQLSGAYQDAYEGPNITALLRAGFAVAATDGAGYLDGEVHPYVSGPDAGHAVLDMVRAAARVPGSGVSPRAQVGIWGYSEGGAGGLWAAQLAGSYAPELNIVGVASGGAPTDLKAAARNLDGSPFAGFLVDALIGLSVTHPDLPFDGILGDTGRTAVRDAETLCAVGTVARFAGTRVDRLTADHLSLEQIYALSGPDGTTWSDVAEESRLGVGVGRPGSGARYEVGFPVLEYHGLLDEVIPIGSVAATRRAYCAAGIPAEWKTYGADHLLGDARAVNDAVGWLGDRFAHRTLTAPSC